MTKYAGPFPYVCYDTQDPDGFAEALAFVARSAERVAEREGFSMDIVEYKDLHSVFDHPTFHRLAWYADTGD